MESKAETRLYMEKFTRQISISLQQAYGNVTIKVPFIPPGLSNEEICRNRALIEEYQNTIVSLLLSASRMGPQWRNWDPSIPRGSEDEKAPF